MLLPAKPRKILIRSTNWIGDAIMTTPAVKTIRQNFPDCHIALLVNSWVAPVFAASTDLDEIIIIDHQGRHKGVLGLWRLSQEIRLLGFEVVILLQNAFKAAFFAFLAGIPVRAGFKRDGRSIFLTVPIPIKAETRKLHHVFYYQQLVVDLGLRRAPNVLTLTVARQDKEWAQQFIDCLATKIIIGLNPGATFGPSKCWPAEKYGQLVAELAGEYDWQFLVFGSEADYEVGEIIKGYYPDKILNLMGKTSLGQVMALIELSTVFVTNDSGLMHVGAALHTPLVAIFGSTDEVATGPFAKNVKVVKRDLSCQPCMKRQRCKDFRCMNEITVADVSRKVRELLGPCD